jgi:hypothetical protein
MVDHTELYEFEGGEQFVYAGTVEAAPAWVDPGWVGADAEGNQILNVPVGDPNGQPYTTVIARNGDTITKHPDENLFLVVSAKPVPPAEEPAKAGKRDDDWPSPKAKTDTPVTKGRRASHGDD